VKLWNFRLALLICFVYRETDYEALLDQYEVLTRTFNGWTLSDIRSLSYREQANWVERSQRYKGGAR
jgi:hypothetical protein